MARDYIVQKLSLPMDVFHICISFSFTKITKKVMDRFDETMRKL